MNKRVNTELLEILVCPICKGPLEYELKPSDEPMRCSTCDITYPVLDGIPDMIPVDSNKELLRNDKVWDEWHTKVTNFVQWRKKTWDGSDRADRLQTVVSDLNRRFSDFTGLKDSFKKIIDIGCGSGGLRELLGKCRYYGIDPLLIDGHNYDFPMVKGIGEHLPFNEGCFDEAVLSQVLDHCKSIDQLLGEIRRTTKNEGSIYIMQFIAQPKGFMSKVHHLLLRSYLFLKGIKSIDTKMRYFDIKGLLSLFEKRFERVTFFMYSDSHVFIKASGWKN